MRGPRNPDSVRRYRLWHAELKKNLQGRCYSVLKNAHNGAMIECSWAKVGMTIEVYDVRTGRELGQYTRKHNTISISRPR